MHDGVWVCDTTPRLLWMNSACEILNDIRREEVCGKLVDELLEAGNFDHDVTRRVLRERRAVAINQKVKSGRTLLVNGVPVFDEQGNIVYVVGNERDLTELNVLRHELSQSLQLSRRMQSELLALKKQDLQMREIVAESEAMERALDTAMRAAQFDSTILLTGPSGSGKSLIASFIHGSSRRREAPFLSLNCGAIPQSLLEAELFGYVRGAFTGAHKDGKLGLIEAAEGGTLFLDEIDAFPSEIQVKLLTFLDTRHIIRVGDTRPRQVDVRLIAATNRDLEAAVAAGGFREDLWFRLNVVPVALPPLSERPEDIPPLVHRWLAHLEKRHSVHRGISPEALEVLCHYAYPGNVRELQNILENCFVLCQSEAIGIRDLPRAVRDALPHRGAAAKAPRLADALDHAERACLERACALHGRQADIAAELGVSQPSVARLLKKHGVKARNRKMHE
jgi:PAS domain S-box-containing protein